MTRATYGRRVVTRTRQTELFFGRIAASLGRGIATLAVAFSVVAGVLTAAGWVFSVASDARTERRSTIGLPQQSQFAWLSIPRSAIAAVPAADSCRERLGAPARDRTDPPGRFFHTVYVNHSPSLPAAATIWSRTVLPRAFTRV